MRADNQFSGKNRAGHPLGMPLFSARARRRDDAPSTDAKNSLDLRMPRDKEAKWRLLLPGASEPRLKVLTHRALIETIAPH